MNDIQQYKDYVIRLKSTVPNWDTTMNRYYLFKEWYKILVSQDNNLVIKHKDDENEDQLEGISYFLEMY